MEGLNFSGITTKGHSFEIITDNDTIYFVDEFGDTLEWTLNEINIKLVESMCFSITYKHKMCA